jgi:hypothetical protein
VIHMYAKKHQVSIVKIHYARREHTLRKMQLGEYTQEQLMQPNEIVNSRHS